MLVTFVSQCQKNALKKTRKVLDAFANRIGDNVWQTAITEDGLRAVRTALTKTASRSTAVSCHRLKSRNQTQLLWIVGNKRQFNELGFVAVNTTKRNILHSEWENHWQFLQALQAVSTLAGLLHDIGKSSNGFQQKLQNKNGPSKIGDPYRHEWLSLKLLYWLLKDCQTDAQVWHRLQTIDEFLLTHTPTLDDIKTHINQAQLHKLPIVTQWLAWLIVTHHRVPPLQAYYFSPQAKKPLLRTNHRFFAIPIDAYYQQMVNAIDGWVKNSKSLDAMNDKQKTAFFCFDNLVWHSPTWQKSLKRYAKKAAEDALLTQLSQQQTAIANPVLLMLSRLSLMIGDHNYSALKQQDKAQRVQGDKAWQDKLIANTDGEEPNQALDEHLLGVGQYTAKFCRNLPLLHQGLPKLTNHEPLAKNTQNPKFLWQNKAFALAKSDSDTAQTHGFFGVNMASTGAGKTIGNARIMYALGNQNGVRLTIALGLRTLTLQTGQSFRQNLQLASDKLAVLVGGQAHQQLHATNEQNSEQNSEQNDTLTKLGSESAEQLIDEWVDADDSTRLDDLHLGTIIKDNKARKLIGSPIVVCTIDHLMQASECKRGGRYIAPLLRLFSSDLILDEPDDFDQSDLPALSRLVHLAGVFGTKVLLSSATLPPDLVAGLFDAYLAGRQIYNQTFNHTSPQVVCAWFDENHCHSTQIDNSVKYIIHHHKFTKKRTQFLASLPPKRTATVLPLSAVYHGEKQAQFYQTIAKELLHYAHQFHQKHHLSANGKTLSIGLIRMANIQPLMHIAQAMHQLTDFDDQQDCHFYLCCYHSQQVLALRNRLEYRLDTILNRHNVSDKDFVNHPDIAQAMAKNTDKTHHIFIVLATPVAEVGRDHDYDWAMVEPSSMRSIIQLAGRVWRHRPKTAQSPNIGIWQYNIQALKSRVQNNQNVVFTRPGFESEQYQLDSHNINELIPLDTLQNIDARCRIQKPATLKPATNLADLEHQVIMDLMNNPQFNVVNAYFKDKQTANRHHTHLSVLTPFRTGRANIDYVIDPNTSQSEIKVYHAQNVKQYGLNHSKTDNGIIKPYQIPTISPFVSVWLDSRLSDVLTELGQRLGLSSNAVVIRFSSVALAEQQNYYFDESFGCWKRTN